MNSPLLHRRLPVAQGPHYPPLAALTRAILHKVQVKRSEGNTLQVMYRGSVEGDCAPASSQLSPITGRGLWGDRDRQEQAHSVPKSKGRNGFIGEGVTILPPQFLPPTYYPCPEGGTVGPGISGPLTCLWQLWRDQGAVGRAGGPPPSQAVRALALGVEAMVGQLGLCQSPSQVRWGQGPQQGWE